MDGHFVPNITFGPPLIKSIRKAFPRIFLDAHLMIEEPMRYLKDFVKSGADLITVHGEVCQDVVKTVRKIHKAGVYAGLTIKPRTSMKLLEPALKYVDLVLVMSVEPGFGGQELIPRTLNKVRQFRLKKEKQKYSYVIEIDGGINKDTAPLAFAAGAEVFVAGSFIYGDGNPSRNIKTLKRSLEGAS